MIELLHIDCMEYMKEQPDKVFDLAIVDPPYGINVIKKVYSGREGKIRILKGEWKGSAICASHKNKDWDNKPPTKEYFDQLFRTSKNQIIWGGNYFTSFLPPISSWIFWDKCTGSSDSSDGELAYTSFGGRLIKYTYMWNGFYQGKSTTEGHVCQGNKKLCEKRIHPTQKPVNLYKWLLNRYAKPGDKIFDSHGGSMSHAIACNEMGFDLTICEIDEEYYNDGLNRYKQHTKKLKIPFT
jgi:site-specific DNA-methyltransferase (adenine-specific)